MIFYFICGFTLLVVCFFVKDFFRRDIKKTKPVLHPFGYKIIYTDQKIKCGNNVVKSKLLKSEKFGLQGKPDFIYKNIFGKIITVELKSGKINNSNLPRMGDMMQLATYFIIIEEVYGKKPKFGNLIYKDYMFKIKNTKSIRKEVIKTVEKMNNMLVSGKGEARCEFVKCRYCLCKGICEFYRDVQNF